MAFVSGSNAAVYLNEFDLTNYADDVSVPLNGDVLETTTFGTANDARAYIRGLNTAQASVAGFLDETLGDTDDITGGTTRAFTFLPEGATLGNACYSGSSLQTASGREASVGGVARFSRDMQLTGGRGHVLSVASVTGTGSLSSVDELASSANGALLLLHVTAANLTTATVVVEDSANDSTWATLGTFTAVTGVTSEAIEVSGTVDRYVRVNVTALTGTSFTPVVSIVRYA